MVTGLKIGDPRMVSHSLSPAGKNEFRHIVTRERPARHTIAGNLCQWRLGSHNVSFMWVQLDSVEGRMALTRPFARREGAVVREKPNHAALCFA
jgi:hypothetical protein